MSRDYRCPALPTKGIEYMVIQRWGGQIDGYIPRSCMDAAGVDTSHFGKNSAVWWDRDKGDRMRAHKHFLTPEEWAERAVS